MTAGLSDGWDILSWDLFWEILLGGGVSVVKMDRDDSESTTSLEEENTENFCDNPTRDTLAEGLMGLFKPAIDQLDEKVRATR